MTSTRPAKIALALLVAGSAGSASCQSPTEVTIVVTTNVDCLQIDDTAIVVGDSTADVETRAESTSTMMCTDGSIGSMVIIPGSSRTGQFVVKVVTGVGVSSDDCLSGLVTDQVVGSHGCIVARRELGFIPETPLVLPIFMRRACIGVMCAPGTTCVEGGACASAVIGDPSRCAAPGGCDETSLVGDSTAGTGGASSSAHSASSSGTGGHGGTSTASSAGSGGLTTSASGGGTGGTGGTANGATTAASSGGTGGASSSSTTTASSSSTSASGSSTTTASSSSASASSSSTTTAASSSSTSASSSSTTASSSGLGTTTSSSSSTTASSSSTSASSSSTTASSSGVTPPDAGMVVDSGLEAGSTTIDTGTTGVGGAGGAGGAPAHSP